MSHAIEGPDSKLEANKVLPIVEIPSRFRHVIKHLYDVRERWDMTIHGFRPDFWVGAMRSGCDRGALLKMHTGYYDVCVSCQTHVLKDHDLYYEPAYEHAVKSGRHNGWNAKPMDAAGGEVVVGQNGVYTVLKPTRSSGPGPRQKQLSVVTAYRIRPRVPSGCVLVAQDFLDAALDKLQDKTDWKRDAASSGTEKGGYR